MDFQIASLLIVILQEIVPGAKPLSITEVRLSKDDDDERESRRERRQNDTAIDKGKDMADKKSDAKQDNHIGKKKMLTDE